MDAIARALQLDDAKRAHLFDLAHAADGSRALARPRRRAAKPWSPRPSLQWTLDAVTEGPAFVRNGRMDLLAANRLARAFDADVYADPQRPANLARGSTAVATSSRDRFLYVPTRIGAVMIGCTPFQGGIARPLCSHRLRLEY